MSRIESRVKEMHSAPRHKDDVDGGRVAEITVFGN